MNAKTLPRAYVNLALRTARLPLTALEQVAHRGDAGWPPALAFDSFQANVKQVVGSMLGDDTLTRQGRLGQARVAELRDAVRLETVAEQHRAEADQTLAERRKADERKRQDADQRADKRAAAAERRKKKAQAEADARARRREAAARKAEADREKEIARQERAATSQAIAKEREAISAAKRATKAEADVLSTDDKIAASKATRKRATTGRTSTTRRTSPRTTRATAKSS